MRPASIWIRALSWRSFSANDNEHERARHLFSTCEAPFRTCEAVLAEACFLMRKIDTHAGTAELCSKTTAEVDGKLQWLADREM